jgi:hypothetical protein
MKQAIKRTVVRVGRPIWKRVRSPIYTRIDWRIDEYLQKHGAPLADTQADTTWEQLVPALLNAVTTVRAYERELMFLKDEQHEEMARLRAEIAALRAQLEDRQLVAEAALADGRVRQPTM